MKTFISALLVFCTAALAVYRLWGFVRGADIVLIVRGEIANVR
jgi:hypothetical protein